MRRRRQWGAAVVLVLAGLATAAWALRPPPAPRDTMVEICTANGIQLVPLAP